MDQLSNPHGIGLFLRREPLDFGYRDRDLVEARCAGVLVRVRPGAYLLVGNVRVRRCPTTPPWDDEDRV
jgi:hypothetical protein